MRIVRSFNRGDFEEGRFREINKSSFKATVRAIRQQSQMTPLVEFLSAIAVCAIIWYGGVSVIDGVMTTGELIAFLIYAINLANPTRRLAESFGNIQKSLAAADRVFAILDEKPEVQDRPGAKPLVVTEGRVEARHVQFAYEKDNPVLTDLNFVAEPGQTIAVVGPSGAGKTTIAKPSSPFLRRNRRRHPDRRRRYPRCHRRFPSRQYRPCAAGYASFQYDDQGQRPLRTPRCIG